MSQLSRYHWFCWHAAAPRRWNSPGTGKEQLLISALQPLFEMHCCQGNTRTNKIKWEFAVTVSAIHCKLPERKKKKNQKNQKNPFSYGFHFKSFFFFLYSVKDILSVDLFDIEGHNMTSLYRMPSAKQQRSVHSVLQRKHAPQNGIIYLTFYV